MSGRAIALLIIAGSAGALGYALYSQYYGGYQPCELCIWQRYAFGVAIGFAVIALFTDARFFVQLAAVALWGNAMIALYHFGIEQHWWQGLQTCSSPAMGGSLDDLRAEIENAVVVRCDDMGWTFLGVSMAGWNVLYSGGLGILAMILDRRRRIYDQLTST